MSALKNQLPGYPRSNERKKGQRGIFVSELDTRGKIFANTWVASSIKDFLDLIQDVIDDFTVDMEIICSIL